jgi:hypothetical protein
MFAARRLRRRDVKKLVLLGAGAVAATSVALLSAGFASSDPVDPNLLNVIGEPYAKAVKILHSQGMSTGFGGSVGSAMPQAECPVKSQKMLTNGKILLMLDCSEEAEQEMAENAVPGDPRVGDNGVTTVQATPVGPQPGMPIPGA